MNWRDSTLCILDTETTGVDPARHRVVEVAIRVASPGQPVFSKSWLVNPGVPVGESAAIHGITDEMLRGARGFHDMAHELAMLVSSGIPAAFNAKFDRQMLINEYLRARIDPPAFLFAPPSWIDGLVWARAHEPNQSRSAGNFKLGAVAKRYGVAIGTAHRAEGDAETTAGVLAHLAAVDGLMPATLEEVLSEQLALAAEHEAGFLRWLANKKCNERKAA